MVMAENPNQNESINTLAMHAVAANPLRALAANATVMDDC
jgi:hypothetical protein